MMLDVDVVAVSPARVWRVLKKAGLLSRWKSKPSRKGTGFEQPLQPHQRHRLHHGEGRAGVSRRSTQNATASWKPPDSSARVTASKPREERSGQPPRCRTAKESYFDPQWMTDMGDFFANRKTRARGLALSSTRGSGTVVSINGHNPRLLSQDSSTSSLRSRDTGSCYRCGGCRGCRRIRNFESSRSPRSIRARRRRSRYHCHTEHYSPVLHCCPNASDALTRTSLVENPNLCVRRGCRHNMDVDRPF